MNLTDAFAQSVNTAAVRLSMIVGLDKAAAFQLFRFGGRMRLCMRCDRSAYLGGGRVWNREARCRVPF